MNLFSRYKNSNTNQINNRDIVVFDIETTGLSISHDEIIEIAACKIRDKKVIAEYETLVNPERPIFPHITKLTGITNEDVKDAPSVETAVTEFLKFIDGAILVGHNIASFDIRFIEAQSQTIMDNEIIDTLRLSFTAMPFLISHKLTDLTDYYGIEYNNAHRAMADVRANIDVFYSLVQQCEKEKISIFESSRLHREVIKKDPWQPNYSEDTIALHSLRDLITDVIEDGVVCDEEVYRIKHWIEHNEYLRGNYPFDKVFITLEQVLEDKKIDDDERELMLNIFQEILNPVQASEHECISCLTGKHCVLTGDFNFGPKSLVEDYIIEKGGVIDNSVKKSTDYVIVGAQGSAAWKQGNYGGKIKKAMEYNEKYGDKGVNIEILTEEDFFNETCHY